MEGEVAKKLHEHDLKLQQHDMDIATMKGDVVEHMEWERKRADEQDAKLDAVVKDIHSIQLGNAGKGSEVKSLRNQISVAVAAVVTLVGIVQSLVIIGVTLGWFGG